MYWLGKRKLRNVDYPSTNCSETWGVTQVINLQATTTTSNRSLPKPASDDSCSGWTTHYN